MPADVLVRVGFEDDGAEAGLNRLGTAFERWEQHEPTRFLRGTSAAIEELAARSVDASGPVARLGEQFLLFGVGGAYGIAILGGLAAVSAAYKALGKDAEDAGASAAKAVKQHQEALDHLVASQQPAAARNRETIGGSQGDLNAAVAELSRLQNLQRQGFTNIANPDYDFWSLAPASLNPVSIPTSELIRRQMQVVTNLRNQMRLGQGGAAVLAPAEVSTVDPWSAQGLLDSFNLTYGAGRASLFSPGRALTAANTPIEFPGFAAAAARGLLDFGATRSAAVDYNAEGSIAHFPFPTDALRNGGVDWRGIAGAGVGIAGAIRGGGGFGSVLSSAGALASVVPGGQLLGAGLDLGGGLLSLFSSGKAKFTISDFEQTAIDKMKQVRADPMTTQYIVIGADRSTAYNIGRLVARGVIPRGP